MSSEWVERAGRRGTRFVTTFAEADPRSLYFLHDPELMISGDIIPPSCYLDAIEILRRQYLAFLLDQAAQGDAGLIPGSRTDAEDDRAALEHRPASRWVDVGHP